MIENTCSITGNLVGGASAICTGQSATLTAQSSFASYIWSTGQTTQSIVVNAAGGYSVSVSDGSCSNISPILELAINPDETPTISNTGDLVFCDGGSVILSSTPATSYAWSNGAGSAQDAVITQSGVYTVTTQGTCGSFTSSPIIVDVLSGGTPSASGTTISSPQSVTLTATGDAITWYDSQTGGTLLNTEFSTQ